VILNFFEEEHSSGGTFRKFLEEGRSVECTEHFGVWGNTVTVRNGFPAHKE